MIVLQVDNEDMVSTLETIVEKFGDEIAPYAEGLAVNLVAAFFKCMEANSTDESDEDLGNGGTIIKYSTSLT